MQKSLLILVLSAILVSFFFVASASTPVLAQSDVDSAHIIVASTTGSSIIQGLLQRVQTSWPWYVTRASGLVAGLALIILMLSGAGFITGQTFRFLEPVTAWATHRALGIILGISVLVHVAALYFDSFVPFSIKDLLVPFASSYRPIQILGFSVGSLYVALGIFAFYLMVAIILTSLFWIDRKPKTWKLVHIVSYVAVVFVFVHALYLGTDLAQGFLRWLWISLGLFVLCATLFRLWRAKTL